MARMEQRGDKRRRRSFTDEFKAGAVGLVLDEGKSIAQVARDLDVTASALSAWGHVLRELRRAESPIAYSPHSHRSVEYRFSDASTDRPTEFVDLRAIRWWPHQVQESMMAIILPGKTLCLSCGKPLQSGDDVVALPAFLPSSHELSFFSDGAFHRQCFDADPRASRVNELYARYRAIWDSRPRHLKTLEEIDAWGREAFKDFP